MREFQSGESKENSQMMGKVKHSRKTSNTQDQACAFLTLAL